MENTIWKDCLDGWFNWFKCLSIITNTQQYSVSTCTAFVSYIGVNVIILTLPINFFFVAVFPENKYEILLIDTFLNFWLEMLFKQSKCFRFSTFNPSFCPWPLACLSWDSPGTVGSCQKELRRIFLLSPSACWCLSLHHPTAQTQECELTQHTAQLHAQMSFVSQWEFPPLIIMHEHVFMVIADSTQSSSANIFSRLINTYYKHYQPWLHSCYSLLIH